MACGIMRTEKRIRGATYPLQLEANRTVEQHEAGLDFPGSDIDWSRTPDNVHLVKTDNWNSAITQQCRDAGIAPRKDAITLLDSVYTASPEWFAEHSRDEMLQYFRDCLEFHARELCAGDGSRIINAVIHLDETTPHMQVASVPIFRDAEGKMHLSAKVICGTNAAYRARQDRFFEQVSKKYGLERGEIHENAEEKRQHTTKLEYLLRQREGELAKVSQTVKQLEATVVRLTSERDAASADLAAVKKDLEDLRARQVDLKREVEDLAAKNDVARCALARMVAAIADVPPFVPEKYPPKPHPTTDFPSPGERRRFDRKTKAWERECKAVDKRNAAARTEWEKKYLTPNNIKAAEAQALELRRQAETNAAAAAVDREKAAGARSEAEALQRNIEAEIDAKAQKKFDVFLEQTLQGDQSSRTERLEAFCERFSLKSGQTILDAFEASERDRESRMRDDWKR